MTEHKAPRSDRSHEIATSRKTALTMADRTISEAERAAEAAFDHLTSVGYHYGYPSSEHDQAAKLHEAAVSLVAASRKAAAEMVEAAAPLRENRL